MIRRSASLIATSSRRISGCISGRGWAEGPPLPEGRGRCTLDGAGTVRRDDVPTRDRQRAHGGGVRRDGRAVRGAIVVGARPLRTYEREGAERRLPEMVRRRPAGYAGTAARRAAREFEVRPEATTCAASTTSAPHLSAMTRLSGTSVRAESIQARTAAEQVRRAYPERRAHGVDGVDRAARALGHPAAAGRNAPEVRAGRDHAREARPRPLTGRHPCGARHVYPATAGL